MSDFVKKNIRCIVSAFLLMGPILDFLTGLSLHYFPSFLTIGVLVRFSFLVFLFYVVLFIFQKNKLLVPYLLIGFYFLFYVAGIFFFKNGVGFLFEVQNLLKVFYFPLTLLSLYAIREEIVVSKMVLYSTLLLYLFLIFLPFIFHVGFQTYAITKTGNLGFFHSANEIGGIISLLTPLLFCMIFSFKNKFLRVFVLLLYFIVILMMGTKTPLLSFAFTLGASLAYFGIRLWKKKKYKQIAFIFLLFLFGFFSLLLILPKTNFYKNIEVHLDFLGIESVSDLFSKKENIDHFIFSQRLSFLEAKSFLYHEAPFYQKLFGIGYQQNHEQLKQIEMDYFDIYYNHGLVGFLLFFAIFLVVLYKVFRYRQKKSYEQFMLETSFTLILILSFFTGHILTAPSVSLLCVILILSLSNYRRKKGILLFEEKRIQKELESHAISFDSFFYFSKNYISRLFFQILSYQVYDFSICDENLDCQKYGNSLSFSSIVICRGENRKDSYRTKREFIAELNDGFLKDKFMLR